MKLMKKIIFLLMICGSVSLYPMEKMKHSVDEMLMFILRRVAPQRLVDQMLFDAIRNEPVRVVDSLLHAGADVNARDSFGWTPLMHAIEQGSIDKVTLLLEKGAYLNAVSFLGKTALNSIHNAEMVQLLLNWISKVLNAASSFEVDEIIDEEVKERVKNIDFEGIDTIRMLYEILNQQMVNALDKVSLSHPGSIEILHAFHEFALRHEEEKLPGLRKEIERLMRLTIKYREENFKRYVEHIR